MNNLEARKILGSLASSYLFDDREVSDSLVLALVLLDQRINVESTLTDLNCVDPARMAYYLSEPESVLRHVEFLKSKGICQRRVEGGVVIEVPGD